MPNIVLIGKTGQVATEVQAAELPADWTLTVLGRAELDLVNTGLIKSVLTNAEPAVIVNAAAYTAVDKAEDEADLAHQINGTAVGEIAHVAHTLSIPLVHISTDYVFDGHATAPWRETDRTNPLGAYGRSKLLGENLIAQSGARAVILRTSWVFSSHGSNFVKTMLRLAASRDTLDVVADQQGGPTAACDIASTIIEIAVRLHQGAPGTGLYHFSGAPATTWADFAETIFEQATLLSKRPVIHRITTAEYPAPARRPAHAVMDCTRLENDYSITQPDWRSSLQIVLQQLKVA